MSNVISRRARTAMAVLMLPLAAAACSRTTAAVAGAGAAAAAAIGYTDRGATSAVDASVSHMANAAEAAFRDMGIALTERETDQEGIEVKGMEGDWQVVVDIERDADDALTDVEVTVSRDLVNYEKSRAEDILRAILRRT
ncbi:MAG TPA: DUF3568 family protein [Longimicrobiales bacterium]|nr:DUF3568 family protein [Longimicrobiales bacterium]